MKNLDIILTCTGAYLILVATITLIGYAAGTDALANWNGRVAMAANTATCFMATGVSLLMLGRRHAKLRKQGGGEL